MRPVSTSSRQGRGGRGYGRTQKLHKQNIITRVAAQWWNRLLGAAAQGSFSEQDEMYESHKTSRDYVWNTVGMASWSILFPLLTIVITQLVGVEQAGMFSLAFVTGSLLMILANFGVRTYQVSDIDEEHTFRDYQVHRIITCVAMVVVGVIYCQIRGYVGPMLAISVGVYLYKMVDALADVYEGRLQQVDKMYLAGVSQAFRSGVVFVVFFIALLISRDVGVASIAMAVAALATFFFLTLPLTLFESPKSHGWSMSSVISMFRMCAPLFVALFLYAFIDAMPKFVMEGALPYDSQLYFNAIYFPAQLILIAVQLVYKPLLTKLAGVWADPSMHKRFDKVITTMVAVIVGVTFVVILFMGWIGIPLMSFLYGIDFEPYRGLSYVMMVAGGVTAAIDFLYQVITVLRRQRDVTKLYLIAFGFSLFVPLLLINFTGLPGAVLGYLILMAILLVLLVTEYISIRAQYNRNPESDAVVLAAMQTAAKDSASAAVAGASAQASTPQWTGDQIAAAAAAAPQDALVLDFDPNHRADEARFGESVAQGKLDEEQLTRAGYIKIPQVQMQEQQAGPADFPDVGLSLDEPDEDDFEIPAPAAPQRAAAQAQAPQRADGIQRTNTDTLSGGKVRRPGEHYRRH